MKRPHDARTVWHPGNADPEAGVDWVTFERTFDLDGPPEIAPLCLFATHRYRLRVNGRVVASGPARYVPGTEWHDELDLRPHLRAGRNQIVVACCFLDSVNFQHAREPRGRFLAWGGVREAGKEPVDLATPGAWRCRRPCGHAAGAPSFSFAIGPVEVLDTRIAGGGWQRPEPVPACAEPRTTPRLTPYATGKIVTPEAVFVAGVEASETRVGYVSVVRGVEPGEREAVRRQASRYALCLHSPETQRVPLFLHWGPHFVNGVELEPEDVPGHGNKQAVEVELRAGWNLLCGEPQQVQPRHPVMIGWPEDAQLAARSRPDPGDAAALRFLDPEEIDPAASWRRGAPSRVEDLPGAAWRTRPRGGVLPLPAREMSWDRPAAAEAKPSLPVRRSSGGGAFTAVLDFADEFLGHVVVKIDAPAGTIVDVGCDERRRADGCLDWFGANPFVDSADRFVAAGGRQTLETFHPRGGRFLQVTLRPPAAAPAPDPRSADRGPLSLESVTVRDAHCPPAYDRPAPPLHDELLAWAWRTGVNTLRASTEEVHCDSPWRERGLYLGDGHVQSMAETLVTTDASLGRRALQLFAAGQFPDGQLPCVVPSWLAEPHGDFTLIYAVWLRDFHAAVDDLALVRACLPAVDRLLASPAWRKSPRSILWDATEANRLFIDWGCLKGARRYDENATLNAFRFAALGAAADLHAAAGGDAEAGRLREEADRVRDAYRERLWLAGAGRFAGGFVDGEPVEREVIHPNVLALALGLAAPEHEERLTEHVVGRLETNAEHAARGVPHDDFVELYFLKHALQALHRVGRRGVAERVVRDHLCILREHGTPTLWECVHRGVKNRGSACHSWSAGYLHHLARR
ncbi:alpha-L-rhamnosidase-related protein [Phycisphaera mikurensis]|uniref:Putative alpha-L-rhamnosidase n=1 Tax=Phycisphaera mikurensis (strain NBRC 102666 / KCTC 22515 / FYK2301M01) TaxID=1142394 RepID=I0ICY9_PHYMF|nr:family 78 glycoside hydrolase catalytic domain [Phycisphaera mikurensis]MBB6442257.1 hypothetical protein [Phycisphaera mikurensis]BAM03127.1 putative alpha-L-rhamnosidase [Phycisphaera mikurensis NBRC 102666]